ncbi:MAG: glycine--tRNA ligase subunit beta, partial [Gammaproteobacteria bacterium]|nr:glycine--tRNA ligase subunit beta [Gammaproteobacteria bacterium]
LNLDLLELIVFALEQHGIEVAAIDYKKADIKLARQYVKEETIEALMAADIFHFFLDRLRTYFLDAGIRADVFEAVKELQPIRPLDFERRVQAVNAFLKLDDAKSLAAANKRIANILRKAGETVDAEPREDLLEAGTEKTLYKELKKMDAKVQPLLEKGDYAKALKTLASLRGAVDKFFDDVMVMTDDAGLRKNRLALLSKLSGLFMHTADLSAIQVD